MGGIKFEDFYEQSLEKWNIENDPQAIEYQKIAESFLSKSSDEMENTDIGRMLSVIEKVATMGIDTILVEYVLPRALAQKMEYGISHPEVQLMVKMLYENLKSIKQMETMSINEFARIVASSFVAGDIAKIKTNNFSEQESKFIAEAIAYFGGYENYDALVEEEYGYGSREEKHY